MVKRGGRSTGITYRPDLTPGVFNESELVCADNTGAKVIKMVMLTGFKGRARRIPGAAVGDVIIAAVKRGNPEMRKQIVRAVIIRQRKPYRRVDGTRIQFEDNAAVIITPEGDLKGTEVRGPVAKEAVDRLPKLASLASVVV
ncbi:50S ribosomal protein L14 [Candidatus Marsarchaeota G2 archaeon ECH_B_SAG-F08]|jgi:large subunit ribosomal protein L14|uniref:Large ribosomal subunit protein uL14 n=3 Tax=Candidatus Marsarchaeota TaxID=1978152 RepID=A0A2R6AK97_9ARCH|nr:MAG: 50S ribosomal protein L14 [Candidatus Marsarchaeota G1 archaeon BE_D]PSN88879.1 MAG: 50S ribosomal protein L14 [Candidatus Marsarchaeota G1 archaeon OSP_C]PSN97511.1 MAG: 50S ribosomal protein L14 [Candidatus Marsarchaeota G2 archaeon ECH_B_SAG-F08]